MYHRVDLPYPTLAKALGTVAADELIKLVKLFPDPPRMTRKAQFIEFLTCSGAFARARSRSADVSQHLQAQPKRRGIPRI